jgi:hypothetical protein
MSRNATLPADPQPGSETANDPGQVSNKLLEVCRNYGYPSWVHAEAKLRGRGK